MLWVLAWFCFCFGPLPQQEKFVGQGQGLNLHHSSLPSHSGDNARPLTH